MAASRAGYSGRVQIHGPTVTSTAAEIKTQGQPMVNQVNTTPADIAPIEAVFAPAPIALQSRHSRIGGPYFGWL